MADFTNRNADETKQFILTFDENGGSPEYTKIEDANGVDRTAEVVDLLGINDKEDADPTILKEGDVEDSLNSTSTTKPLSANQGKQLNDDKASLSGYNIMTDTFVQLIADSDDFSDEIIGVDITPKSVDSVFVIRANLMITSSSNAVWGHIFRDGQEIGRGDSGGSRKRVHNGNSTEAGGGERILPLPFLFIDAPQTISEIRYGIKLRYFAGSDQTIAVNRTVSDQNSPSRPRSVSTIEIIEVQT